MIVRAVARSSGRPMRVMRQDFIFRSMSLHHKMARLTRMHFASIIIVTYGEGEYHGSGPDFLGMSGQLLFENSLNGRGD